MIHLSKTSLLILLISLFNFFPSFSQSSTQTANTYVKPHTGEFGYGANMGYYGNGWNDSKIAETISKIGGSAVRPTLPDEFIEKWGVNIRLKEFQYYSNSLGLKEITCFIEKPSIAHQDKTIYPGNSQPSKLFANLYKPIWNTDGTVNSENYYAAYVYKLVQAYGDYVRFWEVVNEPDVTSVNTANWLTRAPLPSETPNTRAPFYHYIRMLRITYEVVKKYKPDNYVTTGGIGYSEYLDALLRYTDNPDGGAVTAQYPNKGGAYFDVLSYHVYPSHFLRVWENGGFKYRHTSDYAANQIIDHKKNLESVLSKYGYNGSSYPKKHFILTETSISKRTADWRYGSDEMQRNFGIKALVLAQKNDIKQLQFFGLSDAMAVPTAGVATSASNEYKLMGLYETFYRDAPGSEKLTQHGKGFKTTTSLIKGYRYDASRTASLNLPANVQGAAFNKNGEYVYVLWAKTLVEKSEKATATYSFPSSLNISSVGRYEWDHSATGSSTNQSSSNITLSGSPSFFKPSASSTALTKQTITFGSLAAKTFGDPAFTVSATASSELPVSFAITSGPAKISGNTITLTGAGTVVVEATQAGDNNYDAAAPVTRSFTVSTGSLDTTSAVACSATGTILREQWDLIPGKLVSSIPVNTTPSSTSQLTLFEAKSNAGDRYGARIRGYVCPPATGDYTFWIAGDDAAELWLSTDDSPSRKVKIASMTSWTSQRQWDKHASQKSASIRLEAGKRYYIEALHKEEWGGDHLAVGWQLPNGTLERPIAGSRLSPYEASTTTLTTSAVACSATGTILREQWDLIPGKLVSSIPVNTTPSSTSQLTLFEAKSNAGDRYGARIRGYVCPPATGDYTFWIAGDDAAELWLSTDDSPSRKVKIASMTSWTSQRQWDKHASQKSVSIRLEAGKRYYIEALHKEEWGGDHLAVGWQLPNGTLERPIAGSRLSPYEALNASSTQSIEMASTLTSESELKAFPNPFTTNASVEFKLVDADEVTLEVYDVQGKLVRRLYEGTAKANEVQSFPLKAEGLTQGVYIVKLVTSTNVLTQKVMLKY